MCVCVCVFVCVCVVFWHEFSVLQGATMTASVSYSLTLGVTLKIEWDWVQTEVTNAGLTFTGSLTGSASGTFSASKSLVLSNSRSYSRASRVCMVYWFCCI